MADLGSGFPFAPRGCVGRPLQPPTIKPLHRADGVVRGYLVTATVGRRQRKRTVKTLDLANDLAAKWQGSRDESVRHLPTTLSPAGLRAAEAAEPLWASLGLTPIEAATWMIRHYRKPGVETWASVIEQFRQSRRDKHNLKPGHLDTPHIGNLVAAAKDFAAHVKRPEIGTVTIEEVQAWLKTRGGTRQLLGDFRSFARWCVARGKMPDDPTRAIERKKVKRHQLPVVRRPERVAADLAILEAEAPEWVPYYVVCLFGFIRPGLRDGEAQRLDADLRRGAPVIRNDGLLVSQGKNGTPRLVPWKCTGPLREWLMAYPANTSLFPAECDSGPKAERRWKPWRQRIGLTQDVMRHTGITAAYYSGIEQNQLNAAADNLPGMQKRHYLGAWSEEDSVQLYGIRPRYSAAARPTSIDAA
jgi:site-specific recombinase XerC